MKQKLHKKLKPVQVMKATLDLIPATNPDPTPELMAILKSWLCLLLVIFL